jgi:hypothetical protein
MPTLPFLLYIQYVIFFFPLHLRNWWAKRPCGSVAHSQVNLLHFIQLLSLNQNLQGRFDMEANASKPVNTELKRK